VFVELMPLLKQRTLLITVARIDERLLRGIMLIFPATQSPVHPMAAA
jgi:hypothetical protein